MKKEYKRIRNHSIEYFCIMIFFLIMSIIGMFAIFSDSFKGDTKVTAIVLFSSFLLLVIYLFYLWISFYKVYRNIKKINSEETSNIKIKILDKSFIYYLAKHYKGASAIKIKCLINDNIKDALYYIFKDDNIHYKDIKRIIEGYLNVDMYKDSKIIKSLGSKLEKKVNL